MLSHSLTCDAGEKGRDNGGPNLDLGDTTVELHRDAERELERDDRGETCRELLTLLVPLVCPPAPSWFRSLISL